MCIRDRGQVELHGLVALGAGLKAGVARPLRLHPLAVPLRLSPAALEGLSLIHIFGTTHRTRSNAEILCDELAVSFTEIDIANTVHKMCIRDREMSRRGGRRSRR